MFSVEYKGYHIHGYDDRPNCMVNFGVSHHYKSLLAAKLAISKRIKQLEANKRKRTVACVNPYATQGKLFARS